MGLGKTYSTKYLLDSNNNSGAAGQVLSTTSTGIDWADANTLPGAGLWLESGNDIYNSNSGNVGIGTTSPSEMLTVGDGSSHSTINIDKGVSSDGTLLFNKGGTSSAHIKHTIYEDLNIASGAGTLQFQTGTSNLTRMVIKNSGNVGIGTTIPTIGKLVIEGDGGYNSNIGFKQSGAQEHRLFAANNIQYNLIGSSSPSWIWGKFTASGTGLDGVPKMIISTSGNVGIGTDSPIDKLSVRGSAGANSISVLDPTLDLRRASMGLDSLENGFIELRRDNNTVYTYISSSGDSYLNGGNVGIGTTSPNEKLDVRGDMQMYNSFASGVEIKMSHIDPSSGYDSSIIKSVLDTISPQDTGSSMLRFYTNQNSGTSSAVALDLTKSQNAIFYGNVGIGTTNPRSTLEVDGQVLISNTFPALDFVDTNSFTDVNDRFRVRAGGNQGLMQWYDDSNSSLLTLMTLNPNGDVIVPNGNVGIGTTSPNVLNFLETGLNIAAGSSTSTTLQQAGLVISGSSDADDADDFGYLSFTNYQSTLSSDRVAEIRINKGGSNVNTGRFNFYTANGTALNESMVLGETGLLKLSQYGAGTLVSDASGNITVSSGGGAGGPYLPLSAGSSYPLTGDLYISKSTPALRLNDSGDNVPYELRVDGTTFSIKEVTNSRTLMSMTAGAVITLDSLASNTVINTTGAMVVPNGNVVVGGTSSNYKFGVTGGNIGVSNGGNIYVGGFGADAVIGYLGNTSGVFTLRSDGNRNISIGSGTVNNSVFIKGSNGNVGIGTDSPSTTLQIGATTSGNQRFSSGSYGEWWTTETYPRVFLSRDGAASGVSALQFGVGSSAVDTTIQRLPSGPGVALMGGNVGIGTTSPDSKLDVGGDLMISSNKTNNTNKTNRIKGQHYTNAEQPVTFMFSNNFSTTNTLFIGGGSTVENAVTSMVFYTANDNTTTQGSFAMIIDNDQNVGIGNTGPGTKLHVGTGSGATVDTGYQMVIDSAGIAGLQILSATTQSGRIVFGDSGDNDIGMIKYDHTDNSMGFRTNGSGNERMRIDDIGRVGIGTDDPIYTLDVVSTGDGLLSLTGGTKPAMIFKVGTAVVGGIQAQANTSLNVSAYGTSSLNLQTAGTTPRLTILTGGNVGINQTAPAGTLHVQDAVTGDTSQFLITNGTGATLRMGITGSGVNENAHILTNSGEDLEFQIGKAADAVTPSVIFKSGGNVGIGTNSPNTQLEILNNNDQPATLRLSSSVSDGDAVAAIISFENESDNGGVQGRIENIIDSNEDGSTSFKFYTNNTSTPAMTLFNGGNMTIAGTLTQNSDVRLKENIKPIESALDKVKQMQGVEFNKINSSTKEIGVVAQEIEKIIPELVLEDKEGIKSVAYGNITAVLIEAIKEQQKQIEELKQQLNK